jgi:Flp pilus assembly pilin Flp
MLRNVFSRFARDERGVTLVEYGIGVTLAIVVGVVMLTTLGGAINTQLGAAAGSMDAPGCTGAVTVADDGTVTNGVTC